MHRSQQKVHNVLMASPNIVHYQSSQNRKVMNKPPRMRAPRQIEQAIHHETNFHECRNDKSETDSPMHGKERYLALDCEMVGVGPNGCRSALARVSIVDWYGDIVLDTYVRVGQPVTDFRTFVSGIRAQDIQSDRAMRLDQCRALVKKILHGKILIGHGLENDLRVLKVKHPWCDVRDTAKYPPFMGQYVDANGGCQFRPRKLRDLAWEEFGKVIQAYGKAHSSTEDAVAALELYKKHMNDWDELIMWQIQMNWSKQMEVNRFQVSQSVAKPFRAIHAHGRNDQTTKNTQKSKHPKLNNFSVKAKHFQTHDGIKYFRTRSGIIRSSSPENYEPATLQRNQPISKTSLNNIPIQSYQ
mmetsp:Transcript_44816/g.54229  ORF Transcript_44816/g.54229 Transcript_44816/m.54229 type:complete len:356 (-) Transcript_44816:57-1124(-)